MSEPKQIIIIRKDLGMRKGKIAAQAAHASMAAIIPRVPQNASFPEDGTFIVGLDKAAQEWLKGSFVKIVVGTDSEEELRNIYNKAKSLHINCSLIVDEGRTEFGGVATCTAVAVGPAFPEILDSLTGHLKLL